MSLCLKKFSELSENEITALGRALMSFYTTPPSSYYVTANQAAGRYTPELMPFHCDLLSRVERGMTVLELGCGTAHLCAQIEARGGSYIGLDYSDELLVQNRQRFPKARFSPIQADLDEQFDLVASLYTIEHVANPPAYLERLWSLCKPGGLLAIICPDFIDGGGLPPSVFYGRTPRRFREKLRTLAFADAFAHVREMRVDGPRWLTHAQASAPGAFWINLQPRNLHSPDYSIDADAVHLARLKDLVWWLEQKGATIMTTSRAMPDIPPEILRFNCFVLARKDPTSR